MRGDITPDKGQYVTVGTAREREIAGSVIPVRGKGSSRVEPDALARAPTEVLSTFYIHADGLEWWTEQTRRGDQYDFDSGIIAHPEA
jgi:hypothetical protein